MTNRVSEGQMGER